MLCASSGTPQAWAAAGLPAFCSLPGSGRYGAGGWVVS